MDLKREHLFLIYFLLSISSSIHDLSFSVARGDFCLSYLTLDVKQNTSWTQLPVHHRANTERPMSQFGVKNEPNMHFFVVFEKGHAGTGKKQVGFKPEEFWL